jgi:hypothetical protein
MMDRAKNDIILATLEKHGGTCTFQVIMDVAEEHHCDVASAALTSLKRKNKVDYEGMMLLLPRDADIVITTGGGSGGGTLAPAPAPAPKPKPKPPPPAPEPDPAAPEQPDASEAALAALEGGVCSDWFFRAGELEQRQVGLPPDRELPGAQQWARAAMANAGLTSRFPLPPTL